MANKLLRWLTTFNCPSYVIFFVTARCNANCKMCFYKDNMAASQSAQELTPEEYEKISKKIKLINILGISGGEPFLREDLAEIIKIIYKNSSPLVVDLPTNGFFVDSVLRQTEDILKYCRNMTVDLQLSIDGPQEIHNEIRGLKDGFARIRKTYEGLVCLKDKYKNLRVKACVVYSRYNKDYIEELFSMLEKNFSGLDRTVFSVVHGSVSNPEAFSFDWDDYFRICEKIRKSARVKDIRDFHSIFTVALRIAKNNFLRDVLKHKDMFKSCKAGARVVVINETGGVFPCEQLWFRVGDLRKNNYDLDQILESSQMRRFQEKIVKDRCSCHWGLPLSNALLYKPQYYPRVLWEALKITSRSMRSKQVRPLCQ